MSTLQVSIFLGAINEASALGSGQIDLTDFPLTNAQIATFCPSTTAFTCTNPVPDRDYFDIEFDLTNNFWGCNFNFGSSSCGIDFRQGISHLMNKAAFTSSESSIGGTSLPNDDPVPVCVQTACANGGLPAANPCAWDPLAPESSTGNCVVGAPGGTGYNCALSSTPIGMATSGTDTSCSRGTLTGTTNFVWQRQIGSPDFCKAADHFIRAFSEASLAGVTKNGNCVLLAPAQASPGLGWPATLTNGSPFTVPRFFIQGSQPRLDLGDGIVQEICALFTGQPTTGCAGFIGIQSDTTFCGFTTSTTGTPFNCWWMYTGGFFQVFPFDTSLYFSYNSIFATKTTSSPCTSTTFSSFAANYYYLCSPTYDSFSNQTEFAPALSTASSACTSPSGNDPTFGSALQPAASFNGSCGGKLDAVSAGYQAEDLFGKNAFTIPVYTHLNTYGRLSNWSQGGVAPGISTAASGYDGLPNFFNWLNAYSPNPAVPGTIRQGFSTPTSSLDPFRAGTTRDFYLVSNIYDSLYKVNPLCSIATEPGVTACHVPFQTTDWMTVSHQLIPCPNAGCAAGHSVALGTNVILRNNLRSDMRWQDGFPVTAWDVKYTYINLIGSTQASLFGLSPSLIKGIHVVSPTQVDLELATAGAFTEFDIGSITIIPGHVWSACGATQWNSLVNEASSTNNISLVDSCIGTFSQPNVFFCTVVCSPPPDAVANRLLIGSGPWTCQNTGVNTAVPVGTLGTGCSSSNTDNPPAGGTFTLTRTGCDLPGPTCDAPSQPGNYFRGGGALALYFWTGNTGDYTNDFTNLVLAATGCLFKPVGTVGCGRWQQGIGNGGISAACATPPCPMTFAQLTAINTFRFSWIPPFLSNIAQWNPVGVPGIGVGPGSPTTVGGNILPPTPILYAVGSAPSTLTPATPSLSNCAPSISAYPNGGGYDC
jgi:hypothetical protein